MLSAANIRKINKKYPPPNMLNILKTTHILYTTTRFCKRFHIKSLITFNVFSDIIFFNLISFFLQCGVFFLFFAYAIEKETKRCYGVP